MKNLIKRLYYRLFKNVYLSKGVILVGFPLIGRGTRINNASYIGPCEVGNFVSCGGRLVIRSSNHRKDLVNMQDHLQRIVLKSSVKVAGVREEIVKIGHGAWIGDSVIILPNVDIGNGAIIGAGSVVTKSVEPYSIYVGNPAKKIGYRFSPESIGIIEKSEWWNWPTAKMKENLEFFEKIWQ